MKKNVIIVLIFTVFIVITSIIFIYLISGKHKTKPIINNEFLIIYNDGTIPGTTYEIYIDKEFNIEIKETRHCSAVDCYERGPKVYNISYSNKNKESLKKYIENLFSTEDDNVLEIDSYYTKDGYELSEYQVLVLESIIADDEDMFAIEVEPYKYRVDYEHYLYSCSIYLKENDDIKVIEYDDDLKINKSFFLDFKYENMLKVKNFINDQFINTNKNYMNINILNDDELRIMESIVYNNEYYMDNYDDTESNELVFEVHSNRLNCPTVSLEIYSNNTYKYKYGIKFNGDVLVNTGTYTYDIQKILNNIDNYEDNNRGVYLLETKSGQTHILYDNNVELKEFLNEINIVLDKCMEY